MVGYKRAEGRLDFHSVFTRRIVEGRQVYNVSMGHKLVLSCDPAQSQVFVKRIDERSSKESIGLARKIHCLLRVQTENGI